MQQWYYSCLLSIQKSGTALLLFRISRLWYCLLFRTSNIEAHADMYAYTRALLARVMIGYTYPEDIKMLQCVGYL